MRGSSALRKAIATGHELEPSVKTLIEWNQNRYAKIQTVANGSSAPEFDSDLFPIESIVRPIRPRSGLMKARASFRGKAAGSAEGYTTAAYVDTPGSKRYYTSSDKDKYHYWTSPGFSSATGYPGPYAIANVSPYVVYETSVTTNKIVVVFENSVSNPTNYYIQITANGTLWSTISSNIIPNSDGEVILYRQNNGGWSQVEYLDNPTQILGVRVLVTSMSKASVSLNLIEISPRWVVDVSQYLIAWSAENTLSEPSIVTPLGTASANQGGVTLANVDGMFNNKNADSPYYGLIDSNAKVTVDFGTDTGRFGGSGVEWSRQLTMYTSVWSGQDQDQVEISLTDESKFLQEIKPNKMFFQDMTLGEIIWRLCDSVGYNNYNYDPSDKEASQIIPYYWTTGDSTLWEEFNGIAQATQTAIFYDEYGVLQIQTRTKAYDKDQNIQWTLDSEPVTTLGSRPASDLNKLPDIQSLEHTYQYEANTINVVYKPASIGDYNNGNPVMQVVWEPEDTVVLRSSPVIEPMTSSATTLRITPANATTWPPTGIMQIEGEFVRYGSKEYQYYDSTGVIKTAYIKSLAEQKEKDRLNPGMEWRNTFTGRFGDLERGIWNTSPEAHSVDADGYLKRYKEDNKPITEWGGGFILNKNSSTVTLATNATFGQTAWYVASRGAKADSVPYYYGTRLRFPSGGSNTNAAAGLVISLGNGDAGFYCEIAQSDKINAAVQHELNFYVKHSDGTIKRFGPDGGKGIPMIVGPDLWYDIDVAFRWETEAESARLFSIMINGGQTGLLNVTVPQGQGIGETLGGRFGIFTRGYTRAEFEYLYAVTDPENQGFDVGGFYDRVRGGWASGQWDREWTYGYRTITKKINGSNQTVKSRFGSRLFDEFGPIAHEVREYNVDFSRFPALHSSLYCSNDSQIIAPDYSGDPFGASFILANTARHDAVARGTDTITAGEGNDIEQNLLIYGRVVTQDEEKTYTVKDEEAIRRRGVVEVEINNPWIQTDEFAKALGDWIADHWSGGCDELSVSIFGNPLLQLGDLVAINYPSRDMYRDDEKFFVVGISNSWDNGLTTQLTLRRARID